MTIIDDLNADNRSPMYRAPCICSGEATGVVCKHYWAIAQRFPSANAEYVRTGEKHRACTLMSGWPLEFTSLERPSICSRYEPKRAQGLVAITRRLVDRVIGKPPRAPGFVAYDAEFDRYNPMTEDEVKRLRAAIPDDPKLTMFSRGPNPLHMDLRDIVEGEQIGIVKPGGSVPNGTASAETEAALDGIFGGGDIFTKK